MGNLPFIAYTVLPGGKLRKPRAFDSIKVGLNGTTVNYIHRYSVNQLLRLSYKVT